MAKLALVIVGQTDGLSLDPTRRVVEVLNQLGHTWMLDGIVGVKLVDDVGIRALNRDYGGSDESTDVLSFSYNENRPEGLGDEAELGDVIVSLETAARQAESAGTSLDEEVALLVLHGILHICGLDHAETGGQNRVQQLQAEILKAAGVNYRKFVWKQ